MYLYFFMKSIGKVKRTVRKEIKEVKSITGKEGQAIKTARKSNRRFS
jgi:hypothetical protein